MKKELKISNTALALLLLVKVLFLPKNAAFLQRNAGISRIKRALVLKVTFCVYLRTKFQVPNIILTSSRQGEGRMGNGNSRRFTSKRPLQKLTQIRVKMATVKTYFL